MKILLVEDDDNTRNMVISVLKSVDPNFDVDAAVNGDDGLSRYFENFYDLVITDDGHPGMHGTKFLELILERNPRQPVILQSGDACGELEAFRQKHRDVPLLIKPYPLKLLRDVVRGIAHQLVRDSEPIIDRDYLERVGWLIFQLRASVTSVAAYGELAQEKLGPSHPAFALVDIVLKAGQGALAVMKQFEQFDREFRGCKGKAKKPPTDVPDAQH